jgi:hypothetical protein
LVLVELEASQQLMALTAFFLRLHRSVEVLRYFVVAVEILPVVLEVLVLEEQTLEPVLTLVLEQPIKVLAVD